MRVASHRLTYATTEGKTYRIYLTIAELERRLAGLRFVRIHRGTLLEVYSIDEITPWFTGRLNVRLKNEKHTELTVQRDRVRALQKRLNL